MEVIWELYAGLKGCAVELRAAFQHSTSASFPLLFNPLIFSFSYVKQPRWQTKGRLFHSFAQLLFPTSCNSASLHSHLFQLTPRQEEILREAFQLQRLCLCLAALVLMGTSWLLPARPLSNEAGSLTACKEATVQPLHTRPPLGPQHFHRGHTGTLLTLP